jgi:hypothetical protein
MIRSSKLALFSLCVLLLGGVTTTQAATVVCESRNDGYQTCPVDGSGGVRLSRQLSTQGCWKDDTWGYDRNKIWVNRGCRAEFDVGAHSSGSSDKGGAAAAAVVVGLAAAAIIASQHDDDRHKNNYDRKYDQRYDAYYGGNYDRNNDHRYDPRYDDRYHENSRYGYNGYGGDPRSTFSCESRDDRKAYCRVPRSGHVEVHKQRSNSPCTFGRSWGLEGNTVWVKNGCRAEFAVY